MQMFSPRSRSRLLAIGKFQSQLAAAKTLLLKHPDYHVRVLVLHHSWHKKKLLRIAKASRGALAQFLDEENVRLVLTGHVHTAAVKAFQPVVVDLRFTSAAAERLRRSTRWRTTPSHCWVCFPRARIGRRTRCSCIACTGMLRVTWSGKCKP